MVFLFFFFTQANSFPLLRLLHWAFTFYAEWSIVGSSGAVAGVSVVFLHTLPAVGAVHPVARAVPRAARLHPGCDLGSLLQVQRHPVHPQGANAAQEASLASCST